MFSISSSQYARLTLAEKAVVDYLRENPQDAARLSITELAERSYTSPATVSRAIRKLGFSNILEIRKEVSAQSAMDLQIGHVNDILKKSYEECTRTIEEIRIPSILEIVQKIKSARKIYILARGITSLAAEEFEFLLQLQGYNSYLITDSSLMEKLDKLVTGQDLLVIFTVHNTTPEFVLAARSLRPLGTKIVTLCCVRGTPLEELSDVIVYGHSLPIVNENAFNSSSRIPLQILSRIIAEYLAL